MLFNDEYQTIVSEARGSFRDKGSKFIGIALPVKSEIEVKQFLEKTRKEYYDATHHCYAYVIGPDKAAWRENDDGEPSGTAGRPIHGAILSADLTNILIIIIRYYGGTKLGVAGLINAYKTTAKDTLENAVIVTKKVHESFEIKFRYEQMNDVMRIIKETKTDIITTDFGENCFIHCSIRKNDAAAFSEKIEQLINVYIKNIGLIL
jgi:uncharacterized YigZ family protein